MYYLTIDGILDDNGPIDTPFSGKLVHRAAQSDHGTAVIVDRSEVWLYQDNNWVQLIDQEIELNCISWVGDQLLVGTEGARLAWVESTLRFIPMFDDLDARKNWGTPWGGSPDIRSLAVRDDDIFANIHVGHIARSIDGGYGWEHLSNGLHKDVHQVSVDPIDGAILAATANGFYLSLDDGDSFERRWDQNQTYQRAVRSFGDGIYLVSVSNGPSGRAAKIYRSDNFGKSWQYISDIPEASKNINTYQIEVASSGKASIIIENSQIFTSDDFGQSWQVISTDVPKCYQIIRSLK